MSSIRLARLPDRSPVKLTISVLPDLDQRLADYAEFYQQTYGSRERIAELVPAMLAAFLASDKAFARWSRSVAGEKR